MSNDYLSLDRCLCCDAGGLIPVLDLGAQPLANSYHDNKAPLPHFPLAINLCGKCFHAQQRVAVNPDLMFKQYSYVSGTSQTLRDYFDTFAKEVIGRISGPTGKKVLDIACNDGSQLASFIKHGWRAWGVDPAENLVDRARATGAQVLCEYWTPEAAKKLGEKFDVIIAQNVFAHVADPYAFLQSSKLVMHEGSKLFIQTSQADMILNGEFDTIYHEHISFFSARSMQTLAHRAGLFVEDIFITPVHGGSYVFVLGTNQDESKAQARLDHEEKEGRYTAGFFHRFADKARAAVRELKEVLGKYAARGYTLIGFGAAAKGNTLLNFANITLEYIVDENPLKQNLYTPGMNIPIYAASRLTEQQGKVLVVPLAWNFFDEIYRKVKTLRPGHDDIFVTYFPEVLERT